MARNWVLLWRTSPWTPQKLPCMRMKLTVILRLLASVTCWYHRLRTSDTSELMRLKKQSLKPTSGEGSAGAVNVDDAPGAKQAKRRPKSLLQHVMRQAPKGLTDFPSLYWAHMARNWVLLWSCGERCLGLHRVSRMRMSGTVILRLLDISDKQMVSGGSGRGDSELMRLKKKWFRERTSGEGASALLMLMMRKRKEGKTSSRYYANMSLEAHEKAEPILLCRNRRHRVRD